MKRCSFGSPEAHGRIVKFALSPSVCRNGSEFAEMIRKQCVLPSTHTSPAQHTSCSCGDKPQLLSHPLMAPPSLRSRFAKCVLLPPLKTQANQKMWYIPFSKTLCLQDSSVSQEPLPLKVPCCVKQPIRDYQDTLCHGQVEKSRRPVLCLRAQLSWGWSIKWQHLRRSLLVFVDSYPTELSPLSEAQARSISSSRFPSSNRNLL